VLLIVVFVVSLPSAQDLYSQHKAGGYTPESADARGSLRVAAVQLQIGRRDLRSLDDFRSHVEALVIRCVARRADLIVFPEYTSVFLSLIPYYEPILGSESAEQTITRISARDPLIEGFRDFFLFNSGLAERAMEKVFGDLARRFGVSILAGSYFACESSGEEVQLVNRAVLYDRSGEILYSQDKVYLTPFEEEVLGISAGKLGRASGARLNGCEIKITICRDTFFPAWLQVHSGGDVWIDIKANGTAFTQEERERFLRALPARISEGEVPYGVTVCLTGSLLDMLWEGRSSIVVKDGEQGFRFLEKAFSASAEEILFFSIVCQAGN
jgi:predicted amidohydrolase